MLSEGIEIDLLFLIKESWKRRVYAFGKGPEWSHRSKGFFVRTHEFRYYQSKRKESQSSTVSGRPCLHPKRATSRANSPYDPLETLKSRKIEIGIEIPRPSSYRCRPAHVK